MTPCCLQSNHTINTAPAHADVLMEVVVVAIFQRTDAVLTLALLLVFYVTHFTLSF